jgi:hypothetical protein
LAFLASRHSYCVFAVGGEGECAAEKQPQVLRSAEKRFAQDDTSIISQAFTLRLTMGTEIVPNAFFQ